MCTPPRKTLVTASSQPRVSQRVTLLSPAATPSPPLPPSPALNPELRDLHAAVAEAGLPACLRGAGQCLAVERAGQPSSKVTRHRAVRISKRSGARSLTASQSQTLSVSGQGFGFCFYFVLVYNFGGTKVGGSRRAWVLRPAALRHVVGVPRGPPPMPLKQ